MTAASDRAKRDAEIERLYRAGTPQVAIGRMVGLRKPRVHGVLVERGILPAPKSIPHFRRTIWDGDDDDRLRRAIWKRQRDGARAAIGSDHEHER